MRPAKVIYYITTILVSLMMVFAAINYVVDPVLEAAFDHLGFPAYFRIELAVGKVIGVALLWLPVSAWIREWTYAAFFIIFISAFIAHLASGDPVMAVVMPVVFLALLLTSYFTYRVLTYAPAPDKSN